MITIELIFVVVSINVNSEKITYPIFEHKVTIYNSELFDDFTTVILYEHCTVHSPGTY